MLRQLIILFFLVSSALQLIKTSYASGPARLSLEKPELRETKKHQTNDLFKSYLEVSSLRHKVLSQNIANLNTPGYKADEVDIPTKYDELIGDKKKIKRVRMVTTSKTHIIGSSNASSKFTSHKLRDPYEIKPNGNNVSLAQQMTKLSQNQQDYNAALKGYTATNGLLSATLGK
jgi:flagellar basal-body rod protein FlgB